MKLRFLIFLIVSTAFAFLLAKHDVTHVGIETSRYSTVESVLERGTFAIDDSIFSTPDKCERNGHYYGDKPPLLTFVAIAWGRVLKCFGVRYLKGDYFRAVYLTGVLVFVLSCLTGWFFYVGLRQRPRMPEPYRIAMSVLSVASTLVLSYSVTLNNHTPCAAAVMGLVLMLERCESDGLTRLRALLAGVMTGLILDLEFVAGGVLGIAVFVFVLTSAAPRRIENALMYALGAGLLILAGAGMNMVSYGSPLPLYLFTHKPSFVEKNYLTYAFNILFGFEGFFLYMPALLFAGFACASPRMRLDRVFVYMMASTAAAVLLFIAGTSDFGGWCYGYRFLIPFAPVLLYYAAVYFGRPRPRLKRWKLFRLALLWGVLTSVVGVMNPWNAGYEGSSTPENALPNHFKNGFLANAFVFCWQTSPHSALTQFFMDRVYGREYAMLYLMMELNNRNDYTGLRRLAEELREQEPDDAAETAEADAPGAAEDKAAANL
ncbi:MAG: hypothetical protein IKQ16_05825 [Lentisphaeria bacterium]|nr:hypothetical protein [Lentisphaeria bacterium]